MLRNRQRNMLVLDCTIVNQDLQLHFIQILAECSFEKYTRNAFVGTQIPTHSVLELYRVYKRNFHHHSISTPYAYHMQKLRRSRQRYTNASVPSIQGFLSTQEKLPNKRIRKCLSYTNMSRLAATDDLSMLTIAITVWKHSSCLCNTVAFSFVHH